jgi:hypothetical protein
MPGQNPAGKGDGPESRPERKRRKGNDRRGLRAGSVWLPRPRIDGYVWFNQNIGSSTYKKSFLLACDFSTTRHGVGYVWIQSKHALPKFLLTFCPPFVRPRIDVNKMSHEP